MRRTIKAISFSLVTFLIMGAAMPALAYDPLGGPCNVTTGGSGTSSSVCQDKGNGSTNPLTGTNGLFFGISKVIAISTGVIALIVIVVSGFKFITADGDASKAKSARETIVAAVIGLVIVALAGTIISFVLSRI